tara:strand:+ start:441 stop:806 length:366 start_codon:yes stop_codon:yes gene_type:complete
MSRHTARDTSRRTASDVLRASNLHSSERIFETVIDVAMRFQASLGIAHGSRRTEIDRLIAHGSRQGARDALFLIRNQPTDIFGARRVARRIPSSRNAARESVFLDERVPSVHRVIVIEHRR